MGFSIILEYLSNLPDKAKKRTEKYFQTKTLKVWKSNSKISDDEIKIMEDKGFKLKYKKRNEKRIIWVVSWLSHAYQTKR